MLDIDMAAPDFARLGSADAPLDRIYHGMSFGEGPLWNRRDGTFLWVDIVGDTIHRWKPGVGAQVFIRPSTKANGLTFDKEGRLCVAGWASRSVWRVEPATHSLPSLSKGRPFALDPKSTRLNSSHLGISYALFCFKKKKK